jgi:hypothetical protein
MGMISLAFIPCEQIMPNMHLHFLTAFIGRAPVIWAVALIPFGFLCAANSGPDDAGTLTVMTFNLRYASTNPPNSWEQRRPVMRECLAAAAPDVLGTQEGLYPLFKQGVRIDWILSRGPIRTLREEIFAFEKDGQFPSDHLPVVAKVQFQ